MTLTFVRVSACNGPDGCGRNRAIVWQGDCGCWVFKCLICGDVNEARCHEEDEHRDDFDEAAMELAGEYSSV